MEIIQLVSDNQTIIICAFGALGYLATYFL